MDTKRTEGPYPHLHITENMSDAIKMVPTTTWQQFFKSIKDARLPTLENCLDSDLTKERGKLTMVSELEGIFLSIHKHKPKDKLSQ